MSDNNSIGYLIYGYPYWNLYTCGPGYSAKANLTPIGSNSSPFIDIQLSIHNKAIIVQYKLDPSFTGRPPYKVKLLAYEDESFKEYAYSIEAQDNNYFIVDDTMTRQNELPSFLYKLILTTGDDRTFLSDFFGWHPSDNITRHKYLSASEIARRERVRFNYTGLWGYLLKRKSFTPLAIEDVDPVTGEALVDNTSTFGVGQEDGYYTPIITRFSIEERKATTEYAKDGRGSQYVELLKVRAAQFPFIDQHDIIVTEDGKRWIVAEDSTKYFPGTTMIILQQPTLRLIPATDTVYNIAVPPFPRYE